MATSFRRQRRESLRTRLSTWPMKITSFSLNNFAPEEFFGGAKSVSMNGPKFSKSDRTMKAFSFVERNKRKLYPRTFINMYTQKTCVEKHQVPKGNQVQEPMRSCSIQAKQKQSFLAETSLNFEILLSKHNLTNLTHLTHQSLLLF